MSGTDREVMVVRKKTRTVRTRRVSAADLRKADSRRLASRLPDPALTAKAAAARDAAITRAAAVAELGGLAVRKAEWLRAKHWSVNGIARYLDVPAPTIAALFGIGGAA